MKKYKVKMIDVIANIHDLYNSTLDSDINKKDKEFIQNLACTVEHYFKELSGYPEKKIRSVTKVI